MSNFTFKQLKRELLSSSGNILENAEILRLQYIKSSLLINRRKNAQFFTPLAISKFMSSLSLPIEKEKIRILDPGAGTGILSTSLVHHILNTETLVKSIELIAVEIDSALNEFLRITLDECKNYCDKNNVQFDYEVINRDFFELGYDEIQNSKQSNFFFAKNTKLGLFDAIILNPPYKKIRNTSLSRKILNYLGEGTTNAYTAFLSLSSYLLEPAGQIIGITPRSFCNGGYYKRFRLSFFSKLFFHKIHTYSRRDKAFDEDGVLQENMLFVVSPQMPQENLVTVTTSEAPEDDTNQTINVNHDLVIIPTDENKIVHIITNEYSIKILEKISTIPKRLSDSGISVSTGRVVDFRISEQLTENTTANATALFYPFHFSNGMITWPRYSQKKNEAICINSQTQKLLVKSGYYTFCKRFSSKEEKKRIVAAFYDASKYNFDLIGIENHINYFHMNNAPLKREVALGLTIYLNSSLVDQYFRLFNGHTQVNAEDLRYIPIPEIDQLIRIGSYYESIPDQDEIDSLIEKEFFNMTTKENPIQVKKKIEEALSILKQIGLPKDQQNDRSALTLLSLVNLRPRDSWAKSKSVLIGITSIMNFIKENYQREYAPNTRESIRRQTIHQFVQAGIVASNPDMSRPTNSPNFVYEIEAKILELLKSFNSKSWDTNLKRYLASS